MSEIARCNIAEFFTARSYLAVSLMALLLIAVTVTSNRVEAVVLRFSGVLGQSQPASDEPLPFLSVDSVVADKKGRLWIVSRGSKQLLALARNGADLWAIIQKVKLPAPIFSATGFASDGLSFFFICNDWKIYQFDPSSGQINLFSTIKNLGELNPVERKWTALAARPHKLLKGYAAKGRLFLLLQNQVHAFDQNGNNLGIVLKLDHPVDARWHYSSLTVEPESGDLLIGTTWPEATIYRYGSAGQLITDGGWPRKRISARSLLILENQAWALQEDGSAISLPLTLQKASDSSKVEPYWTIYPSGLAQDRRDHHYWMGSSQGLIEFDKYGHPTKHRLGGLPDVELLAITPDGAVLAMVEHRQRLIRLFLDDEPDAAFISNANEPFRMGYSWKQRAVGMAWDGQGLLVLSEKNGQLWRWDPEHIDRPGKPWTKLTKDGQFSEAQALAVADNRFWVLSGVGLLEGALGREGLVRQIRFPELNMSRIRYLAGLDNRTLLIATNASITAWRRQQNGNYNRIWALDGELFGRIASVAADDHYVVVTDSKPRTITLLSANSGQLLATLSSKSVPGGMRPMAVAIQRNWIVVADGENQRLLRFKIIQ